MHSTEYADYSVTLSREYLASDAFAAWLDATEQRVIAARRADDNRARNSSADSTMLATVR